jgi:hypothetical protein
MQYPGMAIRGIPYMGVEEILLTEGLFSLRTKGSAPIAPCSGTSLIQRHQENVSVEFGKEVHTAQYHAKITELFKQRHLTTAVHYKLRDKLY